MKEKYSKQVNKTMIAYGGKKCSARRKRADLEGPDGIRAGFSAVTFKLRWKDEKATRGKVPGLGIDHRGLSPPGQGAGHGRTKGGVSRREGDA